MADSQPVKAPRCPNHPPMSAVYRCDACRMFLCRLCVTQVGDFISCVKCGSLCRVPEPQELAAALARQTEVFHKRTPSG